jgi:hypothetical protein
MYTCFRLLILVFRVLKWKIVTTLLMTEKVILISRTDLINYIIFIFSIFILPKYVLFWTHMILLFLMSLNNNNKNNNNKKKQSPLVTSKYLRLFDSTERKQTMKRLVQKHSKSFFCQFQFKNYSKWNCVM